MPRAILFRLSTACDLGDDYLRWTVCMRIRNSADAQLLVGPMRPQISYMCETCRSWPLFFFGARAGIIPPGTLHFCARLCNTCRNDLTTTYQAPLPYPQAYQHKGISTRVIDTYLCIVYKVGLYTFALRYEDRRGIHGVDSTRV